MNKNIGQVKGNDITTNVTTTKPRKRTATRRVNSAQLQPTSYLSEFILLSGIYEDITVVLRVLGGSLEKSSSPLFSYLPFPSMTIFVIAISSSDSLFSWTKRKPKAQKESRSVI